MSFVKGFILIPIFLQLLFTSCSEEKDEKQKEEWVAKEVINKTKLHRAEKTAQCKNNILLEAELYVDSLIANDDLFSKIIEGSIPEIPTKPEYIPLDSVVLEEHHVDRILDK